MCDCEEYEFESAEESEQQEQPEQPIVQVPTVRVRKKQEPVPIVVTT